jgi:hypothetical protein
MQESRNQKKRPSFNLFIDLPVPFLRSCLPYSFPDPLYPSARSASAFLILFSSR